MFGDPLVALAEISPWIVLGIFGFAGLMFALGMSRDTGSDPKPRSLVVVDDDPDIRRGLKTLVESRTPFGVVGEASSGAVAIQVVDMLHPDLVVMDVKLADVDGIEATRRIKALHPDIPIIGFSSIDDDATGAIMRRAGASAHLVKGDSPDRIVETILDFA